MSSVEDELQGIKIWQEDLQLATHSIHMLQALYVTYNLASL